jgi:hypothetical protein
MIGGGTGSVINRVPDSLGPCSGHSEEAIVLLCLCYTYSQLIKTTDKSVEDKWPVFIASLATALATDIILQQGQ